MQGVETIGVDIDGVLADHVPPVLENTRRAYNTQKPNKFDVTDYYADIPDCPINIAEAIAICQLDASYILQMPVIESSIDIVNKLHREYTIVIISHRPHTEKMQNLTERWLTNNNYSYDELIMGSKKSEIEQLDLLIDDYHEDLEGFLANSGKSGVLFLQPWNIESKSSFSGYDSLHFAESWHDIYDLLK
ncbi:MAG: hypothetical protein U5J64_07750 [Halobacteriales archaeon]|nr:hypothetical protein [Halobacteriales archaeon]